MTNKRPPEEQVRDMLMYRGYERVHYTADNSRYELHHQKGFMIQLVWYHIDGHPGTFSIHVKIPLLEGKLRQAINIKGEQNFIEHFDRLEKALCNAVNQFPFEIQDPIENQNKNRVSR